MELQRDRTDHISSRNKNTTENTPFHTKEKRNERRNFHGRSYVCNINGSIYIGRKGSYHFRRRQTHSRKTSQLQHMLSLTKTVHLKIINLSSNTLNQTEIMLLSKGLKLSPTP